MNISIGRLDDSDPSAQMVIQPADRRWQLVVDKDGYPHLFVEVDVEAGPDTGGRACKGLFCIEDVMPEGGKIRDLMQGVFGDPVTDSVAQAAAWEDFVKDRQESGIPCSR